MKSELDKKQDERRQQNNDNLGLDEEVDGEEEREEIIDEDELAMLTHLKELKKTYRGFFQDLKTVKAQISAI